MKALFESFLFYDCDLLRLLGELFWFLNIWDDLEYSFRLGIISNGTS